VPRVPLPEPSLWITKQQARQFLLAAHGLLPPRDYEGKQGAREVVRSLNAIQFDPINVIGRNPDLVLQSRVRDYRPAMLDELLYRDRKLLDGWDKMSCIYPVEDWPYFERYRKKMIHEHGDLDEVAMQVAPEILEKIKREGHQSSLDYKGYEKADWFWGPAKTSRLALEALFAMGRIGIHHREGNRRHFDLIGNLLPEELLQSPDPNPSLGAYQAWHVRRRIGSLKFAHAHAGAHWGGIMGVKSRQRRILISDLYRGDEICAVGVKEIPGRVFFIQKQDLELLQGWGGMRESPHQAAFIAPLDNLMWDRDLIAWLFNFEYTWEVYKPAKDREFGYYVLPVIYGDRFVARFEPVLDREDQLLMIQGWWWEDGIQRTDDLLAAVGTCMDDFMTYLGAEGVRLHSSLSDEWLAACVGNMLD